MDSIVIESVLNKAKSYQEYKELIVRLLNEGKTTGEKQSTELTEYTKLNIHRMERLEKTISINDELTSLLTNYKKPLVWVILSESWCGDVAQNLPVLNKMAELSSAIELKTLLRDENPEIMNNYLTNGGTAIPKLICLQKDNGKEMGTWGPRPEPVQQMVMDFKNSGEKDYKQLIEKAQIWYAKDETATIQAEFIKLLNHWSTQN